MGTCYQTSLPNKLVKSSLFDLFKCYSRNLIWEYYFCFHVFVLVILGPFHSTE